MHDIDEIRDEQFCLAFELTALTDLLVRKETERWLSGFADVNVEIEHSNRYKWISSFVSGKRVLDIACGTGRGSYILAKEGLAKKVVGCDLDREAIRYASIKNKHDNVSFIASDAQQFDDGTTYDVIISFETIEHIPDVDAFLARIQHSLSQEGHFYVSTPISVLPFDAQPANSFHLCEWGFREFQELIGESFLVEQIYVQLRHEVVLPNFPFLRKLGRLYSAFRQKWRTPGSYSFSPYIMKPI